MRTITSALRAAIMGSILILPLVLMELVNRYQLNEEFPFVLFAFLWLLSVTFILLLMPLVQNLHHRNKITINPVTIIRVVSLIFVAVVFTSILVDQMPCFLGVVNCD